ncbi:hypothetical protein MPER_02065, partial [Moniliophthora perniciosa FA553]
INNLRTTLARIVSELASTTGFQKIADPGTDKLNWGCFCKSAQALADMDGCLSAANCTPDAAQKWRQERDGQCHGSSENGGKGKGNGKKHEKDKQDKMRCALHSKRNAALLYRSL